MNYTLKSGRLLVILGLLSALPAASVYGQFVTVAPTLTAATPIEDHGASSEEYDSNQVDPKSPVEVISERDSDGNISVRREVIQDDFGNYILHGEWQRWDDQGKKVAFGTYRNNKPHGAWTRVHTANEAEMFSRMPFKEFSGPFTSEATFKDGELDGKWVIHDSQHRKISEWNYAKGLRHGISIWTYASGQIMKEIHLRDGHIDGDLRVWDENNKLVVDETYQDGRKLAWKVKYDDKGAKKSEGRYLEPQFVIDKPDDWWHAQPVQFTPIGNDTRHGRYVSWHANGEKRSEETYEHGVPVGPFVFWFASRQKRLVGSYKNGKAHGLWIWWHENGQKATKGQYSGGEPTGDWAYWNKNGQLSQKHDFSLATDAIVVQPGDSESADRSIAETPQSSGAVTVDR